MERHSFLILPFHGFGHFNGLFGVARALEKSHDVIFAGNGYFRSHVTSRGFKFRSLASYPFGLGIEGWIIKDVEQAEDADTQNLIDRQADKLYHLRAAELTKVLEETKPTHVLVDVQQATDVIVLKAIDPSLRISMVSIPPPYLLIPGLPPVNSTALPGDSDDAYKKSLQAIREKVLRQRKKYNGLDDRTMVTRRLKENRMTDLEDIYPSLITFAVKGLDHYVLTYKEYDFHHPHLDQFNYVGAHPDPLHKEPRADYYRKLCEETKKEGKKLVYCSFGTVPSKKDVQGFYDKVSGALAGFNARLLVTTNLNWIAQQTILQFADAFITHGGMNSIHDAIRFKVPVIVYPIDLNYDQNGNSSRVVHNGLGLRGDFDTATVEEIRSKLVYVFENRNSFKTMDTSGYTVEKFVAMLTQPNRK